MIANKYKIIDLRNTLEECADELAKAIAEATDETVSTRMGEITARLRALSERHPIAMAETDSIYHRSIVMAHRAITQYMAVVSVFTKH